MQTIDSSVIDLYVNLKRRYGEEILIDVDVYKVDQTDAVGVIERLNADSATHGIIVQLPLADMSAVQTVVDAVAPEKDVDALGRQAVLEAATPLAIDWLLAGYNIALAGRKLAIVGNGRLVGAPLSKRWQGVGYDVTVFDEHSTDMEKRLSDYDVIVSAAGVPGLITSAMVKHGATVVDAGTASEGGKIVGDVAADVRVRDDLTITPEKGGVGPLTVTALFDNVIRAAQATVKNEKKSTPDSDR